MGKSKKSKSTNDAVGDFDVYLLAQTWNPQFCCLHPAKCSVTAGTYPASHLSLHGLWPGYTTNRTGRTYPQDCQTTLAALKTHVPIAAFDLAPAYRGNLWKHEWSKHGTCTGLLPAVYFAEAMRVMLALPGRGTPQLITQSMNRHIDVRALRNAYPKQVGIQTDSKGNLLEITTCHQKLPNGLVGNQVDCPKHVMSGGQNRCKCDKIFIPMFGACQNAKQNFVGTSNPSLKKVLNEVARAMK